MENKLFLEPQLATGIDISLAGARAWQSRLVMAAAVGEARAGGECQHVMRALVLP